MTSFDISVPIKNIINTLYAKDLSKKSAAALRIKQQNGEFIGTYAAYGYMKSKEDIIRDLIKAIYVYNDKRIEVVWNFRATFTP